MRDKIIEPLVLTNRDKAKTEFKRLIISLIVLLLASLTFLLVGWELKDTIICGLFLIILVSIYIDYRKKSKESTQLEEYLRIDENGIKIDMNGENAVILWDSVISTTFYSWYNHRNFYHIAIKYKQDDYLMTTRINLLEYNEVISHRKWKKAIIHFSGREDIVGNKHSWFVFAKEDNGK